MNSFTNLSITARTVRAGALGMVAGLGLAGSAIGQTFQRTDLVTNVCCGVERFDPRLVSGWGVAIAPSGGPAWVVAEQSGASTLYDGTGTVQALVVGMRSAVGGGSSPSGVVFNPTTSFQVFDDQLRTGPARFIFATREGTITAWRPGDAGFPQNTHARIAVDRSNGAGPGGTTSSYTGVALASVAGGDFLYATDFANGRVDTFDGTFTPVAATFVDPQLPSGMAPFNARVLGGNVLVAYAAPDASHFDAVAGAGAGLIDVYSTNGSFQRRLVTGGALNAPWGMALAPQSFGPFAGALLVANAGDGRINAFDPETGQFLGILSDDHGPLVIDGVHGIDFGNGTLGQPAGTLFYAAAPTFAAVGVYGRIDSGGGFTLPPPCPADFDRNGRASTQDIFAFLSTWFAGDPNADFDRSGSLGVQDVFAFLAAWFVGCP